MSDPKTTYVRFVIGLRDEDSHLSRGVFVAAYALLDSNQAQPYEHELLQEHLVWFKDNLIAPDFLDDPGSERAICWFAPQAKEAIHRVRQIGQILTEHGHQVRMLTTQRPGKIMYQDEHQVAAYPYRDERDQL